MALAPYKIEPYTFNKAEKLGVIVKPSIKGNYKLDVFNKAGELITRVGDKRYKDFPKYLKEFKNTPIKAIEKQKLYKKRHEKDRKIKNSRGFYADNLLW